MDDTVSKIDCLRLKFDRDKHMTTLGSGILVLMTAFLNKAFQEPEWKFLVAVSVVSLFVSIAGAAVSLFQVPVELKQGISTEEIFPSLANALEALMVWGFLIALVSLAAFFLKNYF
jgi:hypothetical protein